MLSMDVSADSLVCRPCRHDVTRVLADAAYVPRWRKRSGESSSCVRNLSFAQASMCSSDELQSIQDMQFQSEPVPIPTPLCKSHYHVVYDALQTQHKHCRTCGRRLRQGNDRPCPQPHAIQAYLSEHTDFAGDTVRSDRVCLTCYKSHLVLLKENKPISRDDDLKSLVDSRQQNTGTGMAHDIICTATNRMLNAVGTMLMEYRATLLPTICSDFNQHTKDLTAAQGIQEPPELKSISSRWILSEITAKYQHHVTYACKVRKHGTLVYRPTSDLFTLLSEAMWKLNLHVEPAKSEALDEHACMCTCTCTSNSGDLTDTCSIGHINKLVHAQIDSYVL